MQRNWWGHLLRKCVDREVGTRGGRSHKRGWNGVACGVDKKVEDVTTETKRSKQRRGLAGKMLSCAWQGWRQRIVPWILQNGNHW